MGRLLKLLTLILFGTSLSWGQTTVTVTGNLANILGLNVTTNAKVCFSLIDASGNPIQDPRTSGNLLINDSTVCVTPNGSGVFSTSIYPNDLIIPGNTQYSVQEYLNGQYVHGDNFTFNSTTPTYNLNTATPNSTSSLPVVPQPSAGATSQACTFTNAVSTWTCSENMGTTQVMAVFRDSNGVQIFPDKAQATDGNTYVGTWLQPQAGSMTVFNVGQWTPSVQFPNYLVANPTAPQTITGQPLNANGGINVVGDVASTFGGSLSAKRIEGQRQVDGFGGTGAAQINSAVGDCPVNSSGQDCLVVIGNTIAAGQQSTPPNNVMTIDQRWTNDPGLGEGVLPNQHSHLHFDFHAGANDAYESGTFSGPVGLTVEGFADGGGFGSSDSTARGFVVPITAIGVRGTGSTRPISPVNSNVSCNELVAITPVCSGGEVDINRHNSDDPTNSHGWQITNGDIHRPTDYLFTTSTNSGAYPFNWANAQNFHQIGLWLHNYDVGADAIRIIPPATDNNFAFRLRNTLDNADVATLDNSGNFAVNGIIAIKQGGPGWFQSGTVAPPPSGVIRLGDADQIAWENHSNTNVAISLGKDTSDRLTFNSQIVSDGTHASTLTIGTGNVTTAGTAVAAGTSQAQTGITVTGALTTDSCTANLGAALPATWQTGIQFRCDVTSANTVTVNLMNPTAGSITPAAQQVNVRVTR